MDCWLNWKKKYSKQIEHVVGYEEVFVDQILSQIPEISPNDVIPQYHFTDDNGRNRYIDFMVLNKAKGYYLPIELDGTYKDVDHHRWKDFLVRQNSLIAKFGMVLRFSNKQMLCESRSVIETIQRTLVIQVSNKITEDSKKKERENLVSWYKAKVCEIEKSINKNDNLSIQISELRELNGGVRSTTSPLTQVESTQSNEKIDDKPDFWKSASVALAVVLLSIAFLVLRDNTILIDTGDVAVTEIYLADVSTKIEKQIVDSGKSTNAGPVRWEEITENQIKQFLSEKPWPPTEAIFSGQALKHIGTRKTVCGRVNQVRHFSRGIYLNLDKVFPDTQFSAVIWNSNTDDVLGVLTSFNDYSDEQICVSGEISVYSGRAQIIVNESTQLQMY